ncbi:MAG: N-formylglutamate amidohydrolase, partial [Rhodomicrobium sp.]|nr:N-formylglutamate amidohydrolase [Rhodomicrobium sp.]
MSHEEAQCIAAELDPAFSILGAESRRVPVIFNSPHSGRVYPSVFLGASRLSPNALRKSEDAYVEELLASAPGQGAVLMHAHFPRAYVDINREPYELDPALFNGRLPDYVNSQSLRAIGGLGTIARIVNDKEEIYSQPLDLETAFIRIERLYKPYHAALDGLLQSTRAQFGTAFLLDCHSMPTQQGERGVWPDFVLGDRFGASCAPEITKLVQTFLKGLGYRVLLNKPYAGGYITQNYGKPNEGIHVLQIEVDRSLYMNEETFEKSPS